MSNISFRTTYVYHIFKYARRPLVQGGEGEGLYKTPMIAKESNTVFETPAVLMRFPNMKGPMQRLEFQSLNAFANAKTDKRYYKMVIMRFADFQTLNG